MTDPIPPKFSPEAKRAALALIDPAADPTPQPAPVDVAEGRRLLDAQMVLVDKAARHQAILTSEFEKQRAEILEDTTLTVPVILFAALLSAAEERDAAKAESGASTKTLLSLPSGDYPVHANVAAAFEAMRSERDRATAALRRVRDQMAECKWSVTPENAEANVKTASMFISAWNLREIDAALASLTKEGGE